MDRFDAVRPPSVLERVVSGANDVLSFPLFPLLKFVPVRFPGLTGHIPFLVNSALWAFGILYIVAIIKTRRPIQPPQPTAESRRGRVKSMSEE